VCTIIPEGQIFRADFSHFVGSSRCLVVSVSAKLCVDDPYNKDLTVKTSGSRGVYGKIHAHF
jgi:hypothetical protein